MTLALGPGDTVAVVAPSGIFDPKGLEAGIALLEDAGLRVHCPPDLLAPHRYLAQTDAVRLTHLTHALSSPDVDAVWAARGGYGVTRLLGALPWEALRPTPVIGFSDLTPLLQAMHDRVGVTCVHGPVLHHLAQVDEPSRAHLFDVLAGRPTAPLRGTAWQGGSASGRLLGGNLAMLAATCGTPWQLDAHDAILCLEDVGEAPYRIDRMLQQLRGAGVFEGIRGIALGTFRGCAAPPDADWTLDDVLRDALLPLGVPIVAHLPFGHEVVTHRALPIGADASLADGTLSWAPRQHA